jgi:hypothetical protein
MPLLEARMTSLGRVEVRSSLLKMGDIFLCLIFVASQTGDIKVMAFQTEILFSASITTFPTLLSRHSEHFLACSHAHKFDDYIALSIAVNNAFESLLKEAVVD